MDPASFNHRTERLSTGRTYHFVDQKPEAYDPATTPTLVCVHGFPDLWYGWRYQIEPWTREGYRVVVPDMLGYGGTDKPEDSSEYSTQKLSDDLAALLDVIGVKKAVLIGHDWGSFTVGRFALWHPDRLLALIMMCVPFTPPTRNYMPVEEVAERAPNLGYQVYFSDKRSTHEIEGNLPLFFKLLFHPPRKGQTFTGLGQLQKLILGEMEAKNNAPCVLNDQEIDYYLREYKNGGLNGPLSYYRTSKVRHEEEQAANLPPSLRPDLPVLFLWGTLDPAAAQPAVIQRMHRWVPRLQDIALEGKGHWVMLEAKEEVAEKVLGWLSVQGFTLKGKL